jgi:hypothetical protein
MSAGDDKGFAPSPHHWFGTQTNQDREGHRSGVRIKNFNSALAKVELLNKL